MMLLYLLHILTILIISERLLKTPLQMTYTASLMKIRLCFATELFLFPEKNGIMELSELLLQELWNISENLYLLHLNLTEK